MGLRVYYPDDIRNALLAAEQANGSALLAADGDEEFTQGYQEGYGAALMTLALALGLVRQVEPEPTMRAYVMVRR